MNRLFFTITFYSIGDFYSTISLTLEEVQESALQKLLALLKNTLKEKTVNTIW